MVPSSKENRRAGHIARAILEVFVAFLLLAYAAETYTHRAFSADPRVKMVVSSFAALTGVLGILPILFHVSPRLGRLGLLTWLASLLLLCFLGWVTKP
jgi:hypothetical protein